MKTPTLEEVKEYFKNAKEVRCVNFKKTYLLENGFYKEDTVGTYYEFNEKDDYIRLYSFKGGYAKIISYKDTYTVSKDFILEAHESACSTWKTKIENQFPELFPKVELEIGKWYKTNNGHLKFFVDENTAYGFDVLGNWNDVDKGFKYSFRSDNYWNLATKEEVETALIAELKKKYKGKNVKCLHLQTKILFDNIIDFRFGDDGCLRCDTQNRCICIFDNGKWAEIISEPIELSLDEIAEKFGVDVSLIKIKK